MAVRAVGHALSRQTINASNTQPSAVAFEVTGPNPCLIVDVALNTLYGPSGTGPTVTGIDFGAAPMTQAAQDQGNSSRLATFYLAAPTIGIDDIQVTLSAIGADSAEIIIVPRRYIYVRQANPTGGFWASTKGDGTNATVAAAVGDTADDLWNGSVAARRDHELIPAGGKQFEKFAGQQGSAEAMVKVAGAVHAGAGAAFTWAVGAGGAYDDWITIMTPLFWDGIQHPDGESQASAFAAASFSPVGRARGDASASFIQAQGAPVRIH